jgi:hypothetical protein
VLEGALGGVGHLVPARETPTPRASEFNAGGTLRTRPLRSDYAPDPAAEKLGEHQRGNQVWQGDRVRYLRSAVERAPYKLEVRVVEIDGRKEHRLVDAEGRLFDTHDASTYWTEQSGVARAIFVMNARGELFASNYHASALFHHSSLAGGEPVAAAGEIRVIAGRVVDVTNNSGHYHPSRADTLQALAVLMAQGMNLRGVKVVDVQRHTIEVLP